MFTLKCANRLIMLNHPMVMGIINLTPDSFYEPSRHQTEKSVLETAEAMLEEGASMLDLGGQSTRPGSSQVGQEDEIKRVIPAISTIRKHFPDAIISVDTYWAEVAKRASEVGCDIINDISAGLLDKDMLTTVATTGLPYILMHMQGTPQNMQQSPQYENVTKEVLDFFIKRVEACRKAGIRDIILDPGIGFGKTITHNYQLIRNLKAFSILEMPILVGLSRKTFISKPLGLTPEASLNGTSIMNTLSLMQGANILRVHDVKEAVQAIKLVQLFEQSNQLQKEVIL